MSILLVATGAAYKVLGCTAWARGAFVDRAAAGQKHYCSQGEDDQENKSGPYVFACDGECFHIRIGY